MAKKTIKMPKLHECKYEPFKILEQNGKFQITLGNAIIDEKQFKTKKLAEEYLATKPYKLIINAACYCMEHAIKAKEYETETIKKENTANE